MIRPLNEFSSAKVGILQRVLSLPLPIACGMDFKDEVCSALDWGVSGSHRRT